MSEKGKIIEVNGDYFLQTSGLRAKEKKETVQIGSVAQKEQLSQLVGQEVEVILSEPVRSVIAILPKAIRPHCYIILCYLPLPDFMRPVLDQGQIEIAAKQLYKEGILSEVNFKRISKPAIK